MKIQKILFAVAIFSMIAVGCKKEEKKKECDKAAKTEQVANPNAKKLALNVSGMSCEIGCAKMIESKLSKQDGVLDAKVVFKDSLATINYDASKTNKASLMSFVEGIAENSYKVTEAAPTCTKKAKECDKAAKKECDASKKKECDKAAKACDKSAKAECDMTKKDAKECSTACMEACKAAGIECGKSCV